MQKAAFNDIHEGSVDHNNWTGSHKDLETELAAVGLYEASIQFMTSFNVRDCIQLLLNEIHGP